MRLRELREHLADIVQRLDLKSAPANVQVGGQPGVNVSNYHEVRGAIEDLRATNLFAHEVDNAMSLPLLLAGDLHAFTPGDVQQATGIIQAVRHAVKRVVEVLGTVAPDVIGAAGVAIRLPIADFDELGASANALVHVDHAIYALTGRKLTFGGFDVGSAWVNILLEHAANDTFSTIVGAFLGAGAAYGKQCYERWRLLREAQAAGIAAADADATLDLALRKYLRDRAEEIAASVKGGTVTPETIERVMLGMQGIGRIVERGGTVVPLLTKGEGGAEGPRVIDAPLELEGDVPPAKFLPLRAELSVVEDDTPKPPPKKKRAKRR